MLPSNKSSLITSQSASLPRQPPKIPHQPNPLPPKSSWSIKTRSTLGSPNLPLKLTHTLPNNKSSLINPPLSLANPHLHCPKPPKHTAFYHAPLPKSPLRSPNQIKTQLLLYAISQNRRDVKSSQSRTPNSLAYMYVA